MNEYDSNRIYDLTNLIGYKKTEICDEAKFFGYDLSQHFLNLRTMTEEVEQE